MTRWSVTFDRIAADTGWSLDRRAQIRAGLKKHAESIADPSGSATWPVWIAFGRKAVR